MKALGFQGYLKENDWVGQKGRAGIRKSWTDATSKGGFWSMRGKIGSGWLLQKAILVP